MLIRPHILAIAMLLLPVFACAEPDAARQQELIHLFKQDCGSCHGMTMKGGLGSPLTPDVLADKPDALLFMTIMQGRPGTPMPPWQGILNREDTLWLIKLMRKGLPTVAQAHP